MKIREVKLRSFRNYEKLSIRLADGMNIIAGNNAQGKTNLLESLIYISLTRSHRISNDRMMIRNGDPFALIACTVDDEGTLRNLRAVIHPQGKTLSVQGNPVKKSSDFIGILNVVLFAPDDLYVFNNLPRERRRIMNQEITKISQKYLFSLNRYQNLLKERNILLKNDSPDPRFLDTLTEQMASCEEYIIAKRREFTETISESMDGLYRQISGSDMCASLRYQCCIDDEECSAGNILAMHQKSREKDIEHRMTSDGIHREDLIFELDGKNVINNASQGQKRMVMLAFKLSLLKYIEKITAKKPVLLLDDVLSELDLIRQKKLIDMIGNSYQCLITATEIPSFIRKEDVTVFMIENGTIGRSGGI